MTEIEIPFEFRNCCFFCGEPKYQYSVVTSDSLELSIPSCPDCDSILDKLSYSNLEEARDKIKENLIAKNSDILKIGAHWSKAELNDAEMTGDLGKFGESAWMTFEIERDRIRFSGWPITVNGVAIDQLSSAHSFEYDGMVFQSRSKMLDFVVDVYDFNNAFFTRVIDLYGDSRIEQAIKFCLVTTVRTSEEMDQAVSDLEESLKESVRRKS